jgi:hypothetical protein
MPPEVLDNILDQCETPYDAVMLAISMGRVEVASRLYDRNNKTRREFYTTGVRLAITLNNKDMLVWLLSVCDPHVALLQAAKQKRFPIIYWLFRRFPNQKWESILERLTEHYQWKGDIDLRIIQVLHSGGCPLSPEVFSNVVGNENRYGVFPAVKWLVKQKCEWDAGVAKVACDNKYFAELEYMLHNGCPWEMDVAYALGMEDLPLYTWMIKEDSHTVLRAEAYRFNRSFVY